MRDLVFNGTDISDGTMRSGYARDREAQLRAIGNGRDGSLATEAANQIRCAKQIITELVAFCEKPEIVAATDGAFDPDSTIQAAKRFLSGGEG